MPTLDITEKFSKMLELIKKFEWSGHRTGQGTNMGWSDGHRYPACPSCYGLQRDCNEFIDGKAGHKEGCLIADVLKDGSI